MTQSRVGRGSSGRRTRPEPGINGMMNRARTLTFHTMRSILLDRKSFALYALLLLLLALPALWIRDPPSSEENASIEFFLLLVVLIYMQFIILYTSLLYGSSLITSESEERTMTYLISRPITRVEILAYKYIGYVASMFIIFGTVTTLNFIMLAPSGDGGLTGNMDVLGSSLGAVLVAIMAWGAVFMLFSLMFKNPLAPGFLYCIFWESLLANIGGNVSKVTVTYQARTFLFRGLTRLNELFERGDGLPPHEAYSPAVAFAVILTATIVMIFISWFRFRDMDFS